MHVNDDGSSKRARTQWLKKCCRESGQYHSHEYYGYGNVEARMGYAKSLCNSNVHNVISQSLGCGVEEMKLLNEEF